MRNHKILNLFLTDETGVLSFEWMLLTIILTLGVIGGMAVFRDTAVLKFGDVSSSALHLDQSCNGSCLIHEYEDTAGTVTAE